MSYDHRTEGFEAYEAFVYELKAAVVKYAEEQKDESHVRGADIEHACYCGYDTGGLDIERVRKHMETVVGWWTATPPTPFSLEEIRSYLKIDEGLVNDFIKMGFRETCPCCAGTCGHIQRLRVARFTAVDGKSMVAEEYLAVDDQDCDGVSQVAVAVYPAGEQPNLQTQVLEA